MHRKHAHLLKAGLVDQRGDAFACGQLAGSMLLFDPIPAAAKLQFGSPSAQVGDVAPAWFWLSHVLPAWPFTLPIPSPAR